MKSLFLCLILVSCAKGFKPKFKVGDCFITESKKDSPQFINKITSLSIKKETYDYLLYWKNRDNKYETLKEVGHFKYDDMKTKVECPSNEMIVKP